MLEPRIHQQRLSKTIFQLRDLISVCSLFYTPSSKISLKEFVPQRMSQVCIVLSKTSLRVSRLNVEMQSSNSKVKHSYFQSQARKIPFSTGPNHQYVKHQVIFQQPKDRPVLPQRKQEGNNIHSGKPQRVDRKQRMTITTQHNKLQVLYYQTCNIYLPSFTSRVPWEITKRKEKPFYPSCLPK